MVRALVVTSLVECQGVDPELPSIVETFPGSRELYAGVDLRGINPAGPRGAVKRCATCNGRDLGEYNGHVNCERCGQKHMKLRLVVSVAA